MTGISNLSGYAALVIVIRFTFSRKYRQVAQVHHEDASVHVVDLVRHLPAVG